MVSEVTNGDAKSPMVFLKSPIKYLLNFQLYSKYLIFKVSNGICKVSNGGFEVSNGICEVSIGIC